MNAVPVPGEILRTDVFLGLTFDELMTLAAVPLVMVFPSLFFEQVPLFVTFAIAGLTTVGMLAVVVRTPRGQSPLEWAPAALKRRVTPDTYYLKPRVRKRDEVAYADVVQTATAIGAETPVDEAETEPVGEATLLRDAEGDGPVAASPSAGSGRIAEPDSDA